MVGFHNLAGFAKMAGFNNLAGFYFLVGLEELVVWEDRCFVPLLDFANRPIFHLHPPCR